jgi:environmental stress-induced protein Ves
MIIRLADCPSQPWKNGLGRTREIAVHPALASNDDYDWRVSIAEVDSVAPFSLFPGIDRQIALLDGAGFTMALDDGRIHALTTPFAPFAFPGEAKVTVALAGGATRDFNLMLRRARVRGEVQAWSATGTRMTTAGTVLVFCARGAIDSADGHLQAGDAWRPEAAGAAEITLHDDTVALVVRVEAVAG